MGKDREFLTEIESYYAASEPEYELLLQRLGEKIGREDATHVPGAAIEQLETARSRFLQALHYLRRFELMEDHLTHPTRLALLKAWLEYRARLSELD